MPEIRGITIAFEQVRDCLRGGNGKNIQTGTISAQLPATYQPVHPAAIPPSIPAAAPSAQPPVLSLPGKAYGNTVGMKPFRRTPGTWAGLLSISAEQVY